MYHQGTKEAQAGEPKILNFKPFSGQHHAAASRTPGLEKNCVYPAPLKRSVPPVRPPPSLLPFKKSVEVQVAQQLVRVDPAPRAYQLFCRCSVKKKVEGRGVQESAGGG